MHENGCVAKKWPALYLLASFAFLISVIERTLCHGLNERVPIKAFYDALDHWSIIMRDLAGY